MSALTPLAALTGTVQPPPFGWCAADYCDAPAAIYAFGSQDRVSFIVGPRGAQLAAMTPGGARCLDCAAYDLECRAGAEPGS